MIITEQALTELLGTTADEIEVPAGASERAWERVQEWEQTRLVGAPARIDAMPGSRWWARPVVLRTVGAAAAVLVVVTVIGIAVGGSKSGNSSRSSSSSAALSAGPEALADRSGDAVAAPAAPKAGAAPPPTVASSDRRIVQNAAVALEVADGKVPDTLERLRSLPITYGGFVAASDSNLTGPSPNGTVTIRVPVAQYGVVRDALLGGTYGKTTSVTESGSDVTAQYTDLSARLAALQISRQTYLTLLSNAKSVGDTLAVQQKLDEVQQQIEQLQGQQKLLADQSDIATLKVTVSETGKANVVPQPRTGFSKAAHDGWHGFTGGLEWLVSISGGVLVAVLLVGIAGLAGRVAVRRIRRPIA